jgi:phage tail P2-like protein
MSGRGGADCRPCRLTPYRLTAPPNATPLETGSRGWQRLSAVDCRLPTCGTRRPARPRAALAGLDALGRYWDTDWTEERKRAITAGAIAAQRRKGSVTVVREVWQAIDELLADRMARPPQADTTHRAVRLPVLDADGGRAARAVQRPPPRRLWPM